MPARASFWRSPCLRRRLVSILKVKASTPPTLAMSLVWQLPCLYREPWVQSRTFPLQIVCGFAVAQKKFCQGGEIIGTSATFLARFHLCVEPWHLPGFLGYFGNDIELDFIILPFTLQNAVLERSPFVQKEAVNSGSFACMPIARDQPIAPTSAFNSVRSLRQQLRPTSDKYPYHRFCSLYH
jgi:hypothetical protein